MTKAEYRKSYAAARKNWPNLTNETMLELRSTYIAASKEVAAIVKDATRRGLSSITSGQYLNLQGQLDRAVTRLSEAIDAGVRSTVTAGWNSYANIETQYIVDSAIKADVLTKIGGSTQIRNFYTGLSEAVVADMISRTYADGHIYSTRVWNAALDYKTQINRVVSTGLSLNRDTISIARDIQVYTADGKTALMQRYGDLEYGTQRFTRRIRKRVDYRALRLVRSELAASLQNAALIAGQNNPASNGLYDWIRVNVQEWGCDCPRYQEEGPYRLEDVPDYPHANCHPAGTLVLTPSGYRKIEWMKMGDCVITASGNIKEITKVWEREHNGHTIEIRNAIGDAVRATPEHPFFSDGVWVQAGSLSLLDNIVCADSDGRHNEYEITRITREIAKETVYNLTVEDDHTFIANGFLSHNCECMVRPQLINNDVFVNDLIRWDQGDDVGYINSWVEKIQ